MSKTILFFGNERLATGVSTSSPALKALIRNGYEVAAVVVAQNDPGRSRQARELEVASVAEEHGIPLLSPSDLLKAKDGLAGYGAQAAVLIAYGKIVPPEVLDIFPAGIINVHPSLLPLHRGSTPIESIILDGADETGVSLMKLAEKMDAGPIYDRVRIALKGDETKQSLADTLAAMGTDLLLKYLPGILGGAPEPVPEPQDETLATVDSHVAKADGVIDWSKPAVRLEREVRAYAGWPKSRTALGSTEIIITKAVVITDGGPLGPGELQIRDKRLIMGTSEAALEILALKPAGKREMTAEGFLAGYNPS